MVKKDVLHPIVNPKKVSIFVKYKIGYMTPYQFVKHKISRITLSYHKWIKRRPLDQSIDPEIKEFQTTCFHICRRLINQNDSELILSPISEKRVVKNERLGIYLTLHSQQAFVTNHVYHYSIVLDARTWERVVYLFNNEIERRRRSYEVVINEQISHSLNDILKKF